MRLSGNEAHTTSEQVKTIRGRLHRLNLAVLLPLLGTVGTLLLVADSETWWEAAVLALGVVVALTVLGHWVGEDISRVAIPGMIITAAVWPFGTLVSGSHTASFCLSIVGAIVVVHRPRHRGAAAFGLIAYVAAVGAARLLVSSSGTTDVLVNYVLLPTGSAVLTLAAIFVSKLFYDLVGELEQARGREAELAVTRERVRFASDLHDIQGHTLHVVKLKTALARKLVRRDAERAEEELGEIHLLVADTISQTKELAYAQRRLNLSAELENAKNLFEAAGILVRVNREADADPRRSEMLGQVLRETTTNILRHAQATRVRITLSDTGIVITNDGARGDSVPELSGLRTLKRRVADDGGELRVEQREGRFTTAAEFPAPAGGGNR
ncbi:sensor histidine kinase [Amycolatopsis antarctica]|uniref:sensor histidine kinase n=1 Tax=Amycolatopsis antarctica TaxID=1854586 RepID=UPI001F0B3422|nr:histidine kinase [Amycolatopsis antarctica]